MAQNPDPTLPLTTITGVTRTLDDWATVFNLAVVLLPGRAEAAAWVPVIDRIYATLGESDVRATVCVAGNALVARRVLGEAADRYLVWCDPDATLAGALGFEHLPAFVHLRQDTSVAAATEGWSIEAWQQVADAIARAQHWTSPALAGRHLPPATPGWPLSA